MWQAYACVSVTNAFHFRAAAKLHVAAPQLRWEQLAVPRVLCLNLEMRSSCLFIGLYFPPFFFTSPLSEFDKFAVITLVCVNLLTGYGHEGQTEKTIEMGGIDLMDFL